MIIFTITTESVRFSYIDGIVSKVILEDIIKRFQIKHIAAAEAIVPYLLSAVGNIISFTKIANYLKQLGIKIKQETLIAYVQYIVKSFALYEVSKFDWKSGRFFNTSRKYYAVDRTTTKTPIEDGLEFYIGLEHLDPQSLRIQRKGIIAEDNPSFTRRFNAGQILFGKRRCYQKKAEVADFDGICSGDIIVMEAIFG